MKIEFIGGPLDGLVRTENDPPEVMPEGAGEYHRDYDMPLMRWFMTFGVAPDQRDMIESIAPYVYRERSSVT